MNKLYSVSTAFGKGKMQFEKHRKIEKEQFTFKKW